MNVNSPASAFGRVQVVEQCRLDRRHRLLRRLASSGVPPRRRSPAGRRNRPTRRTALIDASSASSDRFSSFR